jgi:hypothetical protein
MPWLRSRLLVLAAATLLIMSAERVAKDPVPEDSFGLTVQEVTAQPDLKVFVLTISTSREGTISLDTDRSHVSIKLSRPPAQGLLQGRLLLNAVRIVPTGSANSYIRTQLHSGSRVYSVPIGTTLDAHTSFSVPAGIHKLDKAITIGKEDGRPLTLTVGKPTKDNE